MLNIKFKSLHRVINVIYQYIYRSSVIISSAYYYLYYNSKNYLYYNSKRYFCMYNVGMYDRPRPNKMRNKKLHRNHGNGFKSAGTYTCKDLRATF